MMQLRPYQAQAKDAVLSEWNKGYRKTLLVLPTGTGKTVVFSKVVENQVSRGGRALILAHRGELLTQAADKLRAACGMECALEKAYTQQGYANKLQPCTLEGNVVRISDIIAYVGKDRQDATNIQMVHHTAFPTTSVIGTINSEIINNLVVNIIENSYGQPYIMLDEAHFKAVQSAKRENYDTIYAKEPGRVILKRVVEPMMQRFAMRT